MKTTSDATQRRTRTPAYHHGDLRRALLQAALALPDLEQLSLRQLSASLGVTAAAVYRHFENREALLTELAAFGFDQLVEGFAQSFDIAQAPTDGASARLRLQRLGEAYLNFADSEPALWRLIFGAQAAGYRLNATPQERSSSYDYLPAALLGLHQTGVLPQAPTEADILFAWSAIHGLASLRQGRIKSAQGSVPLLARQAVDRIVMALGYRP